MDGMIVLKFLLDGMLSRNSVVSEIFPYCPTAQMAELMFQNVAYRATVYRTGINTALKVIKNCHFLNPPTCGFADVI